MKIIDLQQQISDLFGMPDRQLTDAIVRATVEGLGFHVSRDGDICDPRPRIRCTTRLLIIVTQCQ